MRSINVKVLQKTSKALQIKLKKPECVYFEDMHKLFLSAVYKSLSNGS